jgi:hypothetical protein
MDEPISPAPTSTLIPPHTNTNRLSLSLGDIRDQFHSRVEDSGHISNTSSGRLKTDIELIKKIRKRSILEIDLQDRARKLCAKYHLIISISTLSYTIFIAIMIWLNEVYQFSGHELFHIVGLTILGGLQALFLITGWQKSAELHRIAYHQLNHIVDMIDIALTVESNEHFSDIKNLQNVLKEIQYMKNNIIMFTPPPVFIDSVC